MARTASPPGAAYGGPTSVILFPASKSTRPGHCCQHPRTPAAAHSPWLWRVAAHITKKDDLFLAILKSLQDVYYSIRMPRSLETSQPSSAMLSSRKAAHCSSAAEASREQGPKHPWISYPPTTTLTLGGCVDPSHLRVCFSVLQQPNQVFPQESRGRSPAPEGFQEGGVKAEDEDRWRVCSRESTLES